MGIETDSAPPSSHGVSVARQDRARVVWRIVRAWHPAAGMVATAVISESPHARPKA